MPGRRGAGLRLRLGDRLMPFPLNMFLIILPEMLPRFNKSSASSAEKSGGSEAALRIESLRLLLRIDGDNSADDSKSLPLAFTRERVSESEGVGATEASLKSLSYHLVFLTVNLWVPCLLT